MTRYTPLWLQAGSYAGSQDRRLIGALWPAPASSGCAVTAQGSTMGVNVAPGSVAVPTQNNSGSTLCVSDAIETVTVTAAPPTGTNRIDLIICRPRGNDLDGGSNNDFIFDFVTGTPAASPAVPATPAGTVALAQLAITGGSASIVAGNITDVRPGILAVPGVQLGQVARQLGPAAQTDVSTSGGTTLVTASASLPAGTYKISGRGQGSIQTAIPAWVNSSLGGTPTLAAPPMLFSYNAQNLSVGGTVAGMAFTVVTLTALTAVAWTVTAAAAGNQGLLRYAANSCEIVVERVA